MRVLVLLAFFFLHEAEYTLGDYTDFDDLLSEAVNKFAEKKNDVVESFTLDLKAKVVGEIEYGEAEEERSDVIDTIKKTLENPSEEADKVEFEEEYEYEDDFTWVVDQGLMMKNVPELDATDEMQGFQTNVIINTDTPDEEIVDQEKSVAKVLKKNATVNLPPKSSVEATWDIVEKEIHIPWTMNIELRGNVVVKATRNGKPRTRTYSLDRIGREGELPSDLFDIGKGFITFHASGYLKSEAAFSDILTYDDIQTENPTDEEVTLDVEEEQPTSNDLAAAEDDLALAVVKGVITSLSENTDDDSKLKPWLKLAGGVANVYSGQSKDPQQWIDIAEGTVDILAQVKNSTAGQKVIEGLKGMGAKLKNKFRKKTTTPAPATGQKPKKPNRKRKDRPVNQKKPTQTSNSTSTSTGSRKPGRPQKNKPGQTKQNNGTSNAKVRTRAPKVRTKASKTKGGNKNKNSTTTNNTGTSKTRKSGTSNTRNTNGITTKSPVTKSNAKKATTKTPSNTPKSNKKKSKKG